MKKLSILFIVALLFGCQATATDSQKSKTAKEQLLELIDHVDKQHNVTIVHVNEDGEEVDGVKEVYYDLNEHFTLNIQEMNSALNVYREGVIETFIVSNTNPQFYQTYSYHENRNHMFGYFDHPYYQDLSDQDIQFENDTFIYYPVEKDEFINMKDSGIRDYMKVEIKMVDEMTIKEERYLYSDDNYSTLVDHIITYITWDYNNTNYNSYLEEKTNAIEQIMPLYVENVK